MTYWDQMQTVAKDAEIVEEKRAAQIVDGTPGSSEGNVERAVRAVDSIRDAFALAQDRTIRFITTIRKG
jgi:hypothetical protein